MEVALTGDVAKLILEANKIERIINLVESFVLYFMGNRVESSTKHKKDNTGLEMQIDKYIYILPKV